MMHSPISLFGRSVISLYLFAAPLLLTAADLLHYYHHFIFSTLAFKMSLVTYVVGSFGLAYLFEKRALYYGLAGAGLVTLGAITFSAISTVDLFQDMLAHGHFKDEDMLHLKNVVETSKIFKTIYLPSMYAFPLGLLVLSIGIYRAQFTRHYLAILLCAGSLLHTVARILTSFEFLFLSEAILTMASFLTGVYILRYKNLD
ncbi:MAG: hypothetical protein JWM14_831 [Chitinophagaceae bacterium]|nr:hypothetical protein [Chitinophagaceae bacterium]